MIKLCFQHNFSNFNILGCTNNKPQIILRGLQSTEYNPRFICVALSQWCCYNWFMIEQVSTKAKPVSIFYTLMTGDCNPMDYSPQFIVGAIQYKALNNKYKSSSAYHLDMNKQKLIKIYILSKQNNTSKQIFLLFSQRIPNVRLIMD